MSNGNWLIFVERLDRPGAADRLAPLPLGLSALSLLLKRRDWRARLARGRSGRWPRSGLSGAVRLT